MAPCDVLRIWDEQHPPLGYVVPSGEMRVCETPVALTIHGKDFPDVPSLEWLAEAVKEKLEREKRDETGLVRCGCGGNLKADESEFGGFYAFCDECGCRSGGAFDTAEQALAALYKAMGR